jgi:multidrug resistance protein, MATE family
VFRQIREYISIGTPNIAVVVLDWACFEITTLMAGYVGVKEQAAQILLLNMVYVLFQIPYGLQLSSSYLIGKQIGAGDIPLAKRYYY